MEIKIKFDDRKLHRGFVNIQKANQIATSNTLNSMAFLSRRNAINIIKEQFIIRNRFTESQLQVNKAAESMPLNAMQSSFGATEKADYMLLQNEGGNRKPKRGAALAIPQIPARMGSKKRTVSKNEYLRTIKKQMIKGQIQNPGTRKSNTVARAYVAFNQKKYLRYDDNIYKIISFKKSRNHIHFRKKHIYNIQHKNPKIKATNWMEKSVERPISDAQNIYNSQINKLLRKDVI